MHLKQALTGAPRCIAWIASSSPSHSTKTLALCIAVHCAEINRRDPVIQASGAKID